MADLKGGNNKNGLPDWQDKVLLVVEDEDHNFTYIYEILKKTKIKILRAETGMEAMRLFRENKVNMILMDIKLPEMDGYEATREIKTIDPGIPVVAQTAYAMMHEREKCRQAGCDDYISKPFEPSRLLEIILKYIR